MNTKNGRPSRSRIWYRKNKKKANRLTLKRRARLNKLGFCGYCKIGNAVVPGYKRCQSCLNKAKAYQKKVRIERALEDWCYACGGDLDTKFTRCSKCLQKQRDQKNGRNSRSSRCTEQDQVNPRKEEC